MRIKKCNKATYRQILQKTCSHLKADNNSININDGQISMLPDLSEGLANEESMKDEIRILRSLSVHMSEKRRMKLNILNKPKLRLRGYDALKWKRRLLTEDFAYYWNQLYNFGIWKNSAYCMQTCFGHGFATYLYLLRHFFWVNLLSFVMLFISILFISSGNTNFSISCSSNLTSCYNCSIHSLTDNRNAVVFNKSVIANHSDGIGNPSYIRQTFQNLFHFVIINKPIQLSSLLISIIYFIITFIIVLKIFVQSFREWLIQNEGQLYRFCNIIFSSWDFCISNEKTRNERKRFIFKEISSYLKKRQVTLSHNQSTKCGKLALVRLIVNFITLLLSMACNIFIYLIYNKRFKYLDLGLLPPAYKASEAIFLEHIPSIIIILFNLIVFRIFKKLTYFEHYNYTYRCKVVIIRTAFFKLTTIITVFIALYSDHVCFTNFSNDCALRNCKEIICFGYYYVDEIYRLITAYFLIRIIMAFFIGYPLLILGSYSSSIYLRCNNFCQMYCNYEYCLDLIYLQTLCWLAVFYDFTAPGVFCFLYFCLFYINKFECLNKFNMMKSEECMLKMNSIFNVILLINCLITISLFAYMVFNTLPLYSCLISGKHFSNLVDLTNLPLLFLKLVESAADCPVYKIITTTIIIILLIINYCYKVTCNANRNMVAVVKNQLLLEGYDKQFLLDRLNLLLKQHTENVN